jgi:predicted permease
MMRTLLARIRGFLSQRERDVRLDEEVQAHLDALTGDYLRRGMTQEQARLAARRAFGAVEPMKEIYRDQGTFTALLACARDARFALRLLTKERWFTAAAVLALALGIAANNTVFVLLNGLLLHDLPFEDPDRVVTVGTSVGGATRANAGISYLDLQDWAAAQRTFDGLGAVTETSMNVADAGGVSERFIGAYVSANTFDIIGRRPILGRGFEPADDRPGATPVVVLSDEIWRARYGADRDVIGRTIRVNSVPATVIGVMSEGFAFPARARLWQPLSQLSGETRARRDARALQGVARLASNVTMAQAADDLRRSADALAAAFPVTNRNVVPRVDGFRERAMGGRMRTAFPILMTMVGFVLLIACANVANLLLARAAYRAREISVRVAVGASRWQIVRQLLIESVVLAGAAGLAALGLSVMAVKAFHDAAGPIDAGGLPYWVSFPVDWRVFTYLTAVCLGTGIVFGLVPAMQASRTNVAIRLAESGTGSSGALRQRRWTTRFVVAQLVLTPILLTGAGLMMRSIVAQQDIDPGVQTAGLVRMRLSLTGPAYESVSQRARFYQQLEGRFAEATDLRVTLASHAPFEGALYRQLSIDGRAITTNDGSPLLVRVMTVGRSYFAVLGTRAVRGDRFSGADGGSALTSAIVNEQFAARYFGSREPSGHRLDLVGLNRERTGGDVSIIGVAPDIRQSSTESQTSFDPIVYIPYTANPLPQVNILARSRLAPGAVATMVREHVRAIDADLALYDVMTLDDSLAISDERLGLRIFGTIFILVGVIALVLATVGLYGVTAYATAQRTREIGIRVALGSRPSQIGWLVARQALRQLAVGLSIGMAGSLAANQILRGVMIGIRPGDYWTLLGVAGLLMVVTICATLVPARRAMGLNPVNALRN